MKHTNLLETLSLILPITVAFCMGWFLLSGLPDSESANLTRARDDLRALRNALLLDSNMPDTQTGLSELIERGLIPFLPQDPWGRHYQYRNPGKASIYDLFSLGPDGVESEDDIDVWNLYPNAKGLKSVR